MGPDFGGYPTETATAAGTLAKAGLSAWALLTSLVPKMHEKKRDCGIVVLNPWDDVPQFPGFRFQHYPESISDTKQVNYAQKAVPGGNLPLYQWINGGERTISFSVVFSSDIDLSLKSKGLGTGTLAEEAKSVGVEDRNVDVKSAILWLRSMLMPSYEVQQRVRTWPPPKLLLWFLGTGIGLSGGARPNKFTGFDSDAVLCVMTQCDVEYKALFPSGQPRLAIVQLAFAEIPQREGLVEFPGDYWTTATGADSTVQTGIHEGVEDPGGNNPGGYNLRPKE